MKVRVTMSAALRECFPPSAGVRTADEVTRWIKRHYPNRWKPGTLRDHLYGGRVNHPLAYKHHPGQKKFLFDHGDHRYERYDSARHGFFRGGHPLGPAEPGWILIHSEGPAQYGAKCDYPTPMAQLEDIDAVNQPGLLWHWKWARPPRESTTPRRILFAWKGAVFGEGVATITHKVRYRDYDFAFVLLRYEPLSSPVPLDRLGLGQRATVHRGLIKLRANNITRFDAVKPPSATPASGESLPNELLDLAVNPQKFSGKGRRRLMQSAAERKCIELRGMKVAKAHLKAAGFHRIKDVSQSEPYDFAATKNGRHFIVEVKGTQGDGSTIPLTCGEVTAHGDHHPNNLLIVVHGIRLDRSGKEPTASGGTAVLTEAWVIDPRLLVALNYSYEIPKGQGTGSG